MTRLERARAKRACRAKHKGASNYAKRNVQADAQVLRLGCQEAKRQRQEAAVLKEAQRATKTEGILARLFGSGGDAAP